MMESGAKCKCGHYLIYHGCFEGKGYCPVQNDGDCHCTVKGLTYKEEIARII